MPTLEDIVRYEIRKHSERIRDLKKAALKTELVTSWDGEHVEKYVDYINPKHPDWAEYQRLKFEASIWLTARRLLKLGWKDDDANGISVLDLPSVKEHTPKSWAPRAARGKPWELGALRRLRRIRKKLAKNPKAFQHVDAWKQLKEMAHA